ncbi:MAG: aminoglycoside phosphotransferase family protein [Reyranella sp.]|nr:aminoglycoside phosphotransferase family protein [Reyranella sp.]
MQGTLGEKIGEGAFADVHTWAPGQVVKLFKAGVSHRAVRYEAHLTRTVFAAGAPAPQVFGEVTVDGRFGLVLQHFDGPTLLHLARSGAVTRQRAGAILAALSLALHKTPLPSGVLPLSLRDLIEAMLREDARGLPPHIAAGILALIERLSPGDGLCHCDLHPGNVIMTAEGPRLVDWSGAVRAPAALDLASIHVLLAELAPEIADDPERPRAVNAAAQSEYARLAGLSEAALAAAMAPYLPIVRARVAHALPDRRARLIPRIEADL